MRKFLVRQVVFLRRGCWPLDENPVPGTSVVCPLCALQYGKDSECNAAYTRQGYITCHSCNRLSAIYLADGTPLVPFANGQRPGGLVQSLTMMDELRPALDGRGHLLDMVSRDDSRPVERISFAMPSIVLEAPEETDEGDRELQPDSPLARLKRFSGFPPQLRELAAVR